MPPIRQLGRGSVGGTYLQALRTRGAEQTFSVRDKLDVKYYRDFYERSSVQLRWTQFQGGDGWREIDGERGTNELAMVNDFRVDVSEPALNGDVAQPRTPNAEPIEVWMPTDKLPSVVFVSTREICKHAEITIDYVRHHRTYASYHVQLQIYDHTRVLVYVGG